MENYRFGDNTIVHSIGFNPWKIESILTNGILSKSEASKIMFGMRETTLDIILMIIFL